MKVGSIFVKIISSLFVLVFGLLCLTTTIFLLAKNMTSQENISTYIKSANIFDYPIRDVISSEKSETLRQNITKEMFEMDIPALVVDEVIDSNELYQIVDDYIYKYSRYILYDEDKPVFLSDKVLDIIKEKYAKHEKKQLSSKQISEVSKYINDFGEKINQDIFEKDELNGMLGINIIRKVASIFDSKYMPIVLILIVVAIFAIISLCLRSIKKAINWCSKITIFDGILLIIASFVEVRVLIMYFNSQGLLDSLAISIIENGFKNMLSYGIILIVVGVIFVTISGILLKKEKKNNTMKISNKPIPMQDTAFIEENSEEENRNQEEQPENDEKEKQNQDETVVQENNDNTKEENEKSEKELEEAKEESKEQSKEEPNEEIEKEEKQVIEEVTIIPISEPEIEEQEEIDERELEETKEIEIEEVANEEMENEEEEQENNDYTEINDQEDEPIIKEDIEVKPLETVKVDLTNPEKGKDIEINIEEEQEDEDIEVL